MPDYKHLLVERRGPVAIVTMNRPEKANALNYDHLAEIEDAALSFRDDGDTRAVVFAGAGKHFSSGADLTDPGRHGDQPLVLRQRVLLEGFQTFQGGLADQTCQGVTIDLGKKLFGRGFTPRP